MPNLPQSTITKEQEILKSLREEEENLLIEEVGQEPELHPEVSPWVERVESLGGEVNLPEPLAHIPKGPQIVSSQAPVVVTLPLTVAEIKEATSSRHEFVEAIFWLAEWCKRIIKIATLRGLRVVFKPKNYEPNPRNTN